MDRIRKILVVEDDSDLADAMADVLTEGGYRVIYVRDGVRALGLLQTEVPDLILVDLIMPAMNGWEFREHQAKDLRLSEIPVLVLTAVDRAEYGVEAAGFLRKPFPAEQLLEVVDKLSSLTCFASVLTQVVGAWQSKPGGRLYPPEQCQDQHYDENGSQRSARVVTPTRAIRPCGERTNKQYYQQSKTNNIRCIPALLV